ncbi:MAG: cysteine hydrolase [Pseudomonadales bacterium]|nr:cysteine hydrolase [Pseudomonadales bacterium]
MNEKKSDDLPFSLKSIALLVIDMQVDFYSNNGSASKKGKPVKKMQEMSKKLDFFIKHYGKLFNLIIFTKYISDKSITPQNFLRLSKKDGYSLMCQKGSGLEKIDGVEIPDYAFVIEKPQFDSFAYISLLKMLREKDIKTLVITGVRTEICIDATAKRAFAEGFDTIILRDLVGTYDDRQKIQDFVLELFNKYSGYVFTSNEFIKMFEK